MKKLNILIIEDHYLMVEGYRSMLGGNSEYKTEIMAVHSCQAAFDLLTRKKDRRKFEIVFLDWSLPPHEKESIANGGDLVKYIKMHSPDAKTIIITSHVEGFTLYQIIKELNPSALLSKSDFSPTHIKALLQEVLQDKIIYSPIVKQQIKNLTTRKIYLDNYNRQIITLLSKGIKTKNLPQYLPLSISAIDKRKALIKDYFLLDKATDEDIIREAKRIGLI